MKKVKIFVVIFTLLFCSISWAADEIETGPFCSYELDVRTKTLEASKPKYPLKAKIEGIEGKVKLNFIVTTKGTARNIEVVESSPKDVFDESAVEAIKKCKFSPGIKNGKPVEAFAEITLNYSMD